MKKRILLMVFVCCFFNLSLAFASDITQKIISNLPRKFIGTKAGISSGFMSDMVLLIDSMEAAESGDVVVEAIVKEQDKFFVDDSKILVWLVTLRINPQTFNINLKLHDLDGRIILQSRGGQISSDLTQIEANMEIPAITDEAMRGAKGYWIKLVSDDRRLIEDKEPLVEMKEGGE